MAERQAAYESGIEAFLQNESCGFPPGSQLRDAWQLGFDDARHDLGEVWLDAPSPVEHLPVAASVDAMSDDEKRALIARLTAALLRSSGLSAAEPPAPDVADLGRERAARAG